MPGRHGSLRGTIRPSAGHEEEGVGKTHQGACGQIAACVCVCVYVCIRARTHAQILTKKHTSQWIITEVKTF